MSPTRTDQVAAIAGAASGIAPSACRRLPQAGWVTSGTKDRDAVTGIMIPAAFALAGSS